MRPPFPPETRVQGAAAGSVSGDFEKHISRGGGYVLSICYFGLYPLKLNKVYEPGKALPPGRANIWKRSERHESC